MREAWDLKEILECSHCHKPFRARFPSQQFCHKACQKAAWLKRVAVESVKRLNPVPQKHRGGWAELVACAWLLELGYEVFRNVSAVGPIDMVAIKGKETLLIDVKHTNVKVTKKGQFAASGPVLKPHQRKKGVIPLYVSADGICSFSLDLWPELYAETLNGALDDMAPKC